MKILGGILAVLLVVALLGGGCAVQGYNKSIALDSEVKKQWAQVDTQLQRRYDLIPNLVASVKGLAEQEQKVFLGIAEARKAYFQAQNGTTTEKVQAANQMESAISRLLLLQENYPQLKSNEAFLKLQDSTEGAENRISVERKRYNDAVNELNVYVRGFPGSFFAGLAGVGPAEFFKITEAAKEVPKIDFSTDKEKKTSLRLPADTRMRSQAA